MSPVGSTCSYRVDCPLSRTFFTASANRCNSCACGTPSFLSPVARGWRRLQNHGFSPLPPCFFTLEARFSAGLGDRSSEDDGSGHGVGANRPLRGRSSFSTDQPRPFSRPSVAARFLNLRHRQSQQHRTNETNQIGAIEPRTP